MRKLKCFFNKKISNLFRDNNKGEYCQQIRFKANEIMVAQLKLLHDASKGTKNQRVIYINTACMLDIMKTLYGNESYPYTSLYWSDTRKSFLELLDENVPQDT